MTMWEIRSSDVGYHLYKDGQVKADLYGFYRDWVKVVELLNDSLTPDAANEAPSDAEEPETPRR